MHFFFFWQSLWWRFEEVGGEINSQVLVSSITSIPLTDTSPITKTCPALAIKHHITPSPPPPVQLIFNLRWWWQWWCSFSLIGGISAPLKAFLINTLFDKLKLWYCILIQITTLQTSFVFWISKVAKNSKISFCNHSLQSQFLQIKLVSLSITTKSTMSPLPKRSKLRKCSPLGRRERELYANLLQIIFLKKPFVFFQENDSDRDSIQWNWLITDLQPAALVAPISFWEF